jgi:hypothetical protein
VLKKGPHSPFLKEKIKTAGVKTRQEHGQDAVPETGLPAVGWTRSLRIS